ncbi:MAG: hypothetical protein CW338_03905, partial [Clostridiales bacterium]|nr:hypothetical protein [Clostridiales bacterium]
MKKLFAAMIALMMILSVSAACAETLTWSYVCTVKDEEPVDEQIPMTIILETEDEFTGSFIMTVGEDSIAGTFETSETEEYTAFVFTAEDGSVLNGAFDENAMQLGIFSGDVIYVFGLGAPLAPVVPASDIAEFDGAWTLVS